MQQLGAIAAGHPDSARAGAEVLAEGGNAVDAAAAAAFASAVTEPTLTGVGGSGFATVHWSEPLEQAVLDFSAAVPGLEKTIETSGGPVPVDVMFGSTTQTFHVGPQSCAVPGFVKGVLQMHERWGTMPRARILELAIDLARNGTSMTDQQAFCHRILGNILTRTPKGQDIFTPTGERMQEGEIHLQPAMADTLETIAQYGADVFYRGDIAREIVKWSNEEAGLISAADLRNYQVSEEFPVRLMYRGFRVIAPPAPSSGGSLIAYHLHLLERALGDRGLDLDSADGARMFVSSMVATNAMRGGEFERWLYGGGLDRWLMSDEAIAKGLERMRESDPDADTGATSKSSPLGNTTHISVVDNDGNAVSITTSTGCGSGEFVGDTGIQLNNMLGEEDLLPVEHKLTPGDRLTSMMSPSIVVQDNRPRLALGSAGSSRIRSAVAQAELRVIEPSSDERDMSFTELLKHAVGAGRLHAEGKSVHAEPGAHPELLGALAADGWKVTQWPERNLYFGGVNMAGVARDGTFGAAGDPRRGGSALIAYDDGSTREP